eukprot:GHVP01068807.1.p2 GENE.GHVP01068807.1~~GHVP01068807.1.p2  ORF type:complete len:224 (+),score=40.91 GHVP01068807.1:924-1595(+)
MKLPFITWLLLSRISADVLGSVDRALGIKKVNKGLVKAPDGIILLMDPVHKDQAADELSNSLECLEFMENGNSICTLKTAGALKVIRDYVNDVKSSDPKLNLETFFEKLTSHEDGDFVDSISPVILILPGLSDKNAENFLAKANKNGLKFILERPIVAEAQIKEELFSGQPSLQNDYGVGFTTQFSFWLTIIVILVILYFYQFFLFSCDASADPLLYTKLPPS